MERRRADGRATVAGIVVAGLLVGAIAVVFRSVADRPVDLVLFSGQSEMPALLVEGSTGVLLLLVLAKGLAYALSLGSGFRGGPVFPAIAMGTALGVAAADLISGLEPAPAVVAGIAAATAVALRAPFTAALLAAVLVGATAYDTAPIGSSRRRSAFSSRSRCRSRSAIRTACRPSPRRRRSSPRARSRR